LQQSYFEVVKKTSENRPSINLTFCTTNTLLAASICRDHGQLKTVACYDPASRKRLVQTLIELLATPAAGSGKHD
jgi:hypothetical protein